jgi:hypothetical protein
MRKEPAVCLVFSENLLHADFPRLSLNQWLEAELARVLRALREIPCSLSIEGFDAEISPDLSAFIANPGKAEVISQEYAHAFSSWLPNEMALSNVALGSHPVCFTAEYNPPKTEVLEALGAKSGGEQRAFFVLDNQSRMYSLADSPSLSLPLSYNLPENVNAIEHAGSLMLLMRYEYFRPVLSEWFSYQCFSGIPVSCLVGEIEKQLRKARSNNVPVVFIPIDIEACMIGSHRGAEIFEEIVGALLASGIPLVGPTEALSLLAPNAVPGPRPDRSLKKWLGYGLQLQLLEDLQAVTKATNWKALTAFEQKLLLLAWGSDAFAVLEYHSGTQRLTVQTEAEPLLIGGASEDSYAISRAALYYHQLGLSPVESLKKYEEDRGTSRLLELVLSWMASESDIGP